MLTAPMYRIPYTSTVHRLQSAWNVKVWNGIGFLEILYRNIKSLNLPIFLTFSYVGIRDAMRQNLPAKVEKSIRLIQHIDVTIGIALSKPSRYSCARIFLTLCTRCREQRKYWEWQAIRKRRKCKKGGGGGGCWKEGLFERPLRAATA